VRLLSDLGYRNVRHLAGGIAGWEEAGLPLESEDGRQATTPAAHPTGGALPRGASVSPPMSMRRRMRAPRPSFAGVIVDFIDRQSTARLFVAWLTMVAVCGLAYWMFSFTNIHGLVMSGSSWLTPDLNGLGTSLYFSFVTATSVGYGDIAPAGIVRVLAVAEAVAGLLIFGAVVSKFVSRRQDELVREIHRITFEDRLDRVQASFHLVLGDLQTIGMMCEEKMVRPERIGARLESAALVFAGELRTTHDLLYRPQWAPEEAVLGSILASLDASLRALREVLACLPPTVRRSPALAAAFDEVAVLADEICGECVPHDYAPSLKVWMDRIQETARGIR